MQTTYTFQKIVTTIKARVLSDLCADSEQIDDAEGNFVISDDDIYEMFQGNFGEIVNQKSGLTDMEGAIDLTVQEILGDIFGRIENDSDYSDYNTAGKEFLGDY